MVSFVSVVLAQFDVMDLVYLGGACIGGFLDCVLFQNAGSMLLRGSSMPVFSSSKTW